MAEAMTPDPSELKRRLETRLAELASAHKRIEDLREQLAKARKKLRTVTEERDAVKGSTEYWLGRKLIQPFRKLFKKLGGKKAVANQPKDAAPESASYHEWRATQVVSEERLAEMREESRLFGDAPLISIVMPVYNTPTAVLEEAMASVRAQAYGKWELIAVDDASTEAHVRPLLEKLSAEDARIVVRFETENGGIGSASNAALAVARGDFVAFLDHDDWLEPDALYEMVRRIVENPEADFIYTDEDKVDEAGYFQQPFFKSDWDPDAMLSCNYCCHFTGIRRKLVEEVGGFRAGFDGAQDYDLFLRATERARAIAHIPRVLYHWRISAKSTAHRSATKPEAISNGARAIEEAIRRRGLDATVEVVSGARYRVRHRIKETKKITILIPTRDRVELLSRCLETLEAHTDWPAYELVILDNDSTDPATVRYLGESKWRVLKYEGPFNFAAICNFGVRETDGEWVLFLNNDTEFTEAGWLTAMAEQVQRPEVGAVGALLLFPSGLVQHAGVVLGERDAATHAYLSYPAGAMENGGQLQMVRGYSAVTAACMLVRREVFDEVGGFDERTFAASYNDVDFCLRLRERGYAVVYTPFARVVHHESASRGKERSNPKEVEALRKKWGAVLARDPFGNQHLTREGFRPLAR